MWIFRLTFVISLLFFLQNTFGLIKKTKSYPEIRTPENPPKCGYEACPKPLPGKLNVHLVPHTHDDVGWLKTVDEYYYGDKNYIQMAGVKYILDSVFTELRRNPKRKFIYVEIAFFWKWWRQQDEWTQTEVKKLVNNGQLEFVSGGWSMNDEAVTHYQSIIDQFTWGLRRLNDTFGKCGQPHVGWQIDPFGHSRGMASIFAELGFDGLLIGRIDYQDKLTRLSNKTLEIIWKGSPNLGKTTDLFTSVLYNHYSPPPGFCYDVLCYGEPFVDDKKSIFYNVPRLVKDFIAYAEEQAMSYTTNNIIMTMGDDFHYQYAKTWYTNLDKLIRYVNKEQEKGKSRVNVFYSTPSCYIKAVHDSNKTWTTKQDDFFPYASDTNEFWTGYFTSRPTLKRFERMGNNFLQVCKQLYSLTDLGPEDWVDLNNMREAMGVLQHHDAVTGTERQNVAFDYARILYKGFEECEYIAQAAINKIIAPKTKIQEETEIPAANLIPMKTCLLLNISQCDVSENSSNFVVTIYNPLSRPVSKYVRFPVIGSSYTVQDPSGKILKVDMIPIPDPVTKIPGRQSSAIMELLFHAVDLPPLGFRSYYISRSNHIYRPKNFSPSNDKDIFMGTSKFGIILDKKTGQPKFMKVKGNKFPVDQSYFYYNAAGYPQVSGAYVFKPSERESKLINDSYEAVTYYGNLVQETQVKFSDWVSHVWRWYHGDDAFEIEWLVGPIPIEDNIGKEIISRFEINNYNSGGLFYTDTNGRETLERKRNFRPTWKLNLHEPVSGNYYPVTSKIALKDKIKQSEFAVITDRSQGGTSLKDGQMELMIHRRLLYDDGFGVNEALNEMAYGKGLVVRGKHWLSGVWSTNVSSLVERDLMDRMTMSPWMFFTPAEKISFQIWSKKYKMEFTGLYNDVPKNVKILTLEPWKPSTFLLRLEHLFEKNADVVYSKPVSVKLKNLFRTFIITSVRETTLGANQWLNEKHRFQWNTKLNEKEYNFKNITTSTSPEEFNNDFEITMYPMQIRTFLIEIKMNLDYFNNEHREE